MSNTPPFPKDPVPNAPAGQGAPFQPLDQWEAAHATENTRCDPAALLSDLHAVVREKPLPCVMVAFGVGALLGMMLGD